MRRETARLRVTSSRSATTPSGNTGPRRYRPAGPGRTPKHHGTYSSDASGLSRVSRRAPLASIAFARSLFGGCPSNGHFATNSSAVGGSHIGPRALAETPPDRRPGSCCRHRGQRKVPATQCSSPRRRGLTSQTRTLRRVPMYARNGGTPPTFRLQDYDREEGARTARLGEDPQRSLAPQPSTGPLRAKSSRPRRAARKRAF